MSDLAGIKSELGRFLKRSPRPRLCGAIVDKNGAELFGYPEAQIDASTVFEIGSIGKTFTATLLALAVRDGIVGLDDPVSAYRPQYPFAASVTLGNLARHTSGLPQNPTGAWTMFSRGQRFAEAFGPDDLEAFLRALPARPATVGRFAYSNVGMALLGHILADRLGLSYEQAVTERLLLPLGMTDTRIARHAYDPRRIAEGHDARGRKTGPMVWRGMEPAGLWLSTVADMARFLAAQMGGAGPDWTEIGRSMTRPAAAVATDTDVGLGWMLSPHADAGPVAWHTGGTFGQHAVVQWSLERELAIVILTNRKPPLWHHLVGSRRLEDLADRIMGMKVTNAEPHNA